tara:strand:- start:591 stop:785 length:195 start_codon:yes stop_codon:yes gene_type:complete
MSIDTPTKNKNYIFEAVFLLLIIIILFVDSLITLFSGLTKGIFKKEIITSKNNLGFDFEIRMKS